jgi:hypothetical protein
MLAIFFILIVLLSCLLFFHYTTGPDFKQTGDRLRKVIEDLFEQTCAIVIDMPLSKSHHHQEISISENDKHTSNTAMYNTTTPTLPSSLSTNGKGNSADATLDHDNNNYSNDNKIHHMFGAIDYTLVYDKEWSAARINGGFSFLE